MGSLWMLLQQNELIALANDNQNQKSTPNILTYTELRWSLPPTVSSTKEGVCDSKTSHVTWTAGVFHPYIIGKCGHPLVSLFEFCRWETRWNITGTYRWKLHQKNTGRKSRGGSDLIYSEGRGRRGKGKKDSDHKDFQSSWNAKQQGIEKHPSLGNPRRRFSFEEP